MTTLAYNQVVPKKVIRFNEEPYEVLSSHVFGKQQRKPVNQTKLRHLVTGKVLEHSFHQNEQVSEADIEVRDVVYLYTNRGESWFHTDGNPSDRFSLPEELVSDKVQWLSEKAHVQALVFEEKVLTIRIPIKVDLAVTEAAPAVRGNTAQGATKVVVLESGASVTVPLFINQGDIVRINTDTGEYTERVEKS